MREIKFRAWDISKGEMIKLDAWDVGREYLLRRKDSSSMRLMQFTGLKDQNGKEIYEGDILAIKVANEYGSASDDRGEVVFHPEAAQFVLTKNGMVTNIANNVEIIGNIYESSEQFN